MKLLPFSVISSFKVPSLTYLSASSSLFSLFLCFDFFFLFGTSPLSTPFLHFCLLFMPNLISFHSCILFKVSGDGVDGCQPLPGDPHGPGPWEDVLSALPDPLWHQAPALCWHYPQGNKTRNNWQTVMFLHKSNLISGWDAAFHFLLQLKVSLLLYQCWVQSEVCSVHLWPYTTMMITYPGVHFCILSRFVSKPPDVRL